MRNRRIRQCRQKNKGAYWKCVGGRGLLILMIAAEVMMLYFVGPLLTAGASSMTHVLYGHDQHSTRRLISARRSSCVIARPRGCAPAALVTAPRTLSGVIHSPIVNGGSSVIDIKDRDQTISFSFETDVIDNRGSAVGWRVSEDTTALHFGTTGPSSDLFFDELKPSVVTCVTNSTCTSTGAIAVAPLGQDMVPGPVTIADASFATGVGSFAITTLGYFIVPANASIGQTTGGVITITISGAP